MTGNNIPIPNLKIVACVFFWWISGAEADERPKGLQQVRGVHGLGSSLGNSESCSHPLVVVVLDVFFLVRANPTHILPFQTLVSQSGSESGRHFSPSATLDERLLALAFRILSCVDCAPGTMMFV